MRLENLKAPSNPVDVVLDTDTFNEVDDQFALAYLLANEPRLHTRAIFAAPFVHPGKNAETCMEESYAEILRILEKANRTSLISSVYKGSRCFLENEETPVKSEAAEALCRLAASYSPEKPLYVVATVPLPILPLHYYLILPLPIRSSLYGLAGTAMTFPKQTNIIWLRTSPLPVLSLKAARLLFSFRASALSVTFPYLIWKSNIFCAAKIRFRISSPIVFTATSEKGSKTGRFRGSSGT